VRFRRQTFTGAAALALAGFITVSCGGINDPSKNTTETFTGTVTRGGQSQPNLFTVSTTGEFTVKITNLTPSYSGQFGAFYGQGDASSCAPFAGGVNQFTTVNAPALSGQILKGTYCVVVFDSLNAFPTGGETFTMTVSHP